MCLAKKKKYYLINKVKTNNPTRNKKLYTQFSEKEI